MEIRNITKEDLPKLAELISCEEFANFKNIRILLLAEI